MWDKWESIWYVTESKNSGKLARGIILHARTKFRSYEDHSQITHAVVIVSNNSSTFSIAVLNEIWNSMYLASSFFKQNKIKREFKENETFAFYCDHNDTYLILYNTNQRLKPILIFLYLYLKHKLAVTIHRELK